MKGRRKWSLKERLVERCEQLLLINEDVIEERERQSLINDINLLQGNDDIKSKLLECIAYCKHQHDSSCAEILGDYDSDEFDLLQLIVLTLL